MRVLVSSSGGGVVVGRVQTLGSNVYVVLAGLAMGETRRAGVDLAFACPGIILLGACPGIILLGEVPNDLRFTFGFCDSQQPIEPVGGNGTKYHAAES